MGYRYGFNGMEFDKETGAYTTLHRMLDVRLGEFATKENFMKAEKREPTDEDRARARTK